VDAVLDIAANLPGDRLDDRLTRTALREDVRRCAAQRKPAESKKRSATHQESNRMLMFGTLGDRIDGG